MKAYYSTAMAQLPGQHLHPGQVVWVRDGSAGAIILSRSKSRQDTFATVAKSIEQTLEPYTDHLGQVVTIAEAAEILGVKKARISQLLERGQILGRKAGGSWLVDRRSVEIRRDYLDRVAAATVEEYKE